MRRVVHESQDDTFRRLGRIPLQNDVKMIRHHRHLRNHVSMLPGRPGARPADHRRHFFAAHPITAAHHQDHVQIVPIATSAGFRRIVQSAIGIMVVALPHTLHIAGISQLGAVQLIPDIVQHCAARVVAYAAGIYPAFPAAWSGRCPFALSPASASSILRQAAASQYASRKRSRMIRRASSLGCSRSSL